MATRCASQPPADADTLFEYGSITKTFTALLLADAAVRGELKLDDAVEAALPDKQKLRDSAGAPITWADLATHRSGLQRARDAQWDYSNLGVGLLGEALAMRAGKPYASLLRERVLQPLGLEALQLALRGPVPTGLATGHDARGRPVPNWRFDAIAPAGALVGSARSLARYAQAALGVFDHPLQQAFKLALAPRAAGPAPQNPMGLGWIIAPLFDRRVFMHDGGTAGYASSLVLDPTPQRAALVLSNAAVEVNDLAIHLLDARAPLRDRAADKRATEREAARVPIEALTVLVGRYAVNPQFKVEVRVREGRLFAQATNQGEFEIFALDARRFFARVTALEIHFEGESGTPPAFLLHQAGQKSRFVRE
jgi:serine-type D-Ala-D-Ala carboxypeptidase/endopeptidase